MHVCLSSKQCSYFSLQISRFLFTMLHFFTPFSLFLYTILRISPKFSLYFAIQFCSLSLLQVSTFLFSLSDVSQSCKHSSRCFLFASLTKRHGGEALRPPPQSPSSFLTSSYHCIYLGSLASNYLPVPSIPLFFC